MSAVDQIKTVVTNLTTTEWAIVATVVIAALTLLYVFVRSSSSSEDDIPGRRVDDGVRELGPPNIRTARWGLPQILYRLYKQHVKRRKLASKGYVQWFLVDDVWPTPKYVKPEGKGGGIPEKKHGGGRYLFPQNAMVPSEQQGMRTYVHKRDEADPVNIRDPSDVSIPTDRLEEYLDLRVTSSPPGLFDSLGISGDDAVKYAIGATILIAVLAGVMGGGV